MTEKIEETSQAIYTDAFQRKSKTAKKAEVLLLVFAIYLSGFCGISYEVLYSRILGNHIGNHFVVNASLLITFLFGIGLGSKFAHRLSGYLWAVESGIGLYALFFTFITPYLDQLLFHSLPLSGVLNILACCFLLAVPSLLVGISLPLFAAYLQKFFTGRVFGICYMVYNFGAALMVVATEFYFIRKFGLRTTVWLAAGLNIIIGLSLFISRHNFKMELNELKSVKYPRKVIISLILISIPSAIFQLLMLKIAEFIFGPYHETFAMVLSTVLMGIALGSLFSHFVHIRFKTLILLNLLFLTLLIIFFKPILFLYADHFQQLKGPALIYWKFTILFMIMGFSSICFGAAVPSLLKEEINVAKESGFLLYVSSIANVAGYLLMVLIIHQFLNYGQILVLLIIVLALSLTVISWPGKVLASIGAIAVLTSVTFLTQYWDEEILFLEYTSFRSRDMLENAISSYSGARKFRKYDEVFAIVKAFGKEFFFINGYRSIALNTPSEYIVGTLSSLVSPRTDEALVLGLGSGATAGTVARIFSSVDAVEINPIIVEKQSLMKKYNFDIINKKHVTLVSDDGMRFIKTTDKKYDLILNTVTTPLYFSASKLYTRDFFKDVKAKLRSDGIYTTWFDLRVGEAGLKIILKTLQSEFKYCWVAIVKESYFLLICSNEKINLHQDEKIYLNEKLRDYFLTEHGLNLKTFRYSIVSSNAFGYLDVADEIDFNTLDRPTLEFEMSKFSRADLSKFHNYIKDQYIPGRMNQEVFKKPPLVPVDLAAYYLLMGNYADRSNINFFGPTLSDFFIEMSKKNDKDFSQKLENNVIGNLLLAVEKLPSVKTQVNLASWRLYFGRVKEAEDILTRVVSDNPQDLKAKLKLTKVYLKQNKFDLAEKMFMQTDPNGLSHYQMALNFTGQNEHERAVYHYSEALKHRPNSINLHTGLGRALFNLRRFEEAVFYFQNAVKIQPDSVLNHSNLGMALFKLGRSSDAVRHYRKAIQIQPDSAVTYRSLGYILTQNGEFDAAISPLRKALQFQPDMAMAHYDLGFALFNLDRLDEAISHYRRAIRYQPDFPDSHNNLGAALFKQGKFDDAVIHFREALRLKPDSPGILDNLNVALEMQRK